MEPEKRVLVIGAGAVGGVLGGLLARAGREVVFLVHGEEAAGAIRGAGLQVSGVRGVFTVKAEAAARPEELSGGFAAVLAAVKGYDLSAAVSSVLPLVPPDCPVVSLQNGICLDLLEKAAGKDRSVGCVVGWGATMHGPGRVELTSEGGFVIGALTEGGKAAAEKVRTILSDAFPTTVTPEIFEHLYSKLIINSCITTLGALCGQTLGWMMGKRSYRTVFIGIIREAMAVADALGIRVPPYGGALDYYAFRRGKGPTAGLRRHIVLRVVGGKYRRLKSSSLQSLERGRPTEVDNYNGTIARRAKERGVPVPLNEALTAMVHEIEAGRRKIGPENLSADLVRLARG